MKVDATRHTEFLQMLRQCEGTLAKVCLYFSHRNPEALRDLYQEIACALWESWPSFRGDSSTNTWVMRVALNVAGQEARRRKRISEFVELDESFYSALADQATNLRYHRLYTLIDHLDNDDDRKLVFLYLDRHRLREIAEMTGSTEAAVKQKLYRIKQKLHKLNTLDDE